MVSGIPPVLVSITCCASLLVPGDCEAKVSEVGDRAAVAGVALVPLSATLTGPIEVLSVSVAVGDPAAVGLKVTQMVQPALVGTVAVQLFVCENQVGLAPVKV